MNMLKEADRPHDALEDDEDWILYLRRCLPYSFLRICKKKARNNSGNRSRYVLSEPKLGAGSEYHNFWKRGYVYYAAGKMSDAFNLPRLWN